MAPRSWSARELAQLLEDDEGEDVVRPHLHGQEGAAVAEEAA